jgi:hypothetical protein
MPADKATIKRTQAEKYLKGWLLFFHFNFCFSKASQGQVLIFAFQLLLFQTS